MAIPVITDTKTLDNVCKQFANSTAIAVDTEFKRESTYYPIPCLIQITDNANIACIDALAISDFTPLQSLFHNENITKIFHAARQDLEIFYHMFNALPHPIFDTQIAATLLGYPDQVGYANLVQSLLQITLDKSLTRTDWQLRPFTDAQLEYATNDVIYLYKIYTLMKKSLDEQNRLHWLNEDFERLCNTALYQPDPATAWQKIKNFNQLKERQQKILYLLANWREKIAIEKNRPRTFILKSSTMMDIANKAPNNVQQLHEIKDLPANTIKRSGKTIIDLITQAELLTASDLPVNRSKENTTESDPSIMNCLQIIVASIANDNQIDPVVLASKKELEKFLAQEDSAVLHGWRNELVGKNLTRFINGELSISVEKGKKIALKSKADLQ